jgi:predicted 2-oxoglutarate/Fe(II)-dependent dioxygenase YbiX
MTGHIVDINWRRGMVAVDTHGYGYSIFELLSEAEFEAGDEVAWEDDTTLGSDYVTNVTRGERVEVFFQNHWVSPAQLRQQLLYK